MKIISASIQCQVKWQLTEYTIMSILLPNVDTEFWFLPLKIIKKKRINSFSFNFGFFFLGGFSELDKNRVKEVYILGIQFWFWITAKLIQALLSRSAPGLKILKLLVLQEDNSKLYLLKNKTKRNNKHTPHFQRNGRQPWPGDTRQLGNMVLNFC